MNVALESPEMLLLIIPVIVAGFYLLRKTKTKLVEWRMLVALLLVLALAAPYTTVTQTISEEDPSLVFVQDQTASMGIFPEETGTGLYEALTANTPTTLVQLTGDKTSLGDAVTQYSGLGNQIVLVTDGNNNAGKDLTEALRFAKDADTPVYLVQPELETNDLSVEVLGDKTVVVNNKNEFEVVVRQASEQSVSYLLEIFVDGTAVPPERFSQDARSKTIPFNQAFNTLGAHNIRVRISDVSGGDLNEVNNEFYKSLYVIPKPKLTLVTGETGSPLASVLSSLYEVSVVNEYPGAEKIKDSKVLVLDNQFIESLSENDVKEIKSYVTNGKGLIVVGGIKSYDRPASSNYRNSSFEELLPIISKPSETIGKNYVVLLLDLSGSTFQGGPTEHIVDRVATYPLYPILIDSSKNILKSSALEGSEVGIVVVGDYVGNVSSELRPLNAASISTFEGELSSLKPTNKHATTNLSQGIFEATNLFEKEAPPGSPKYIIIVSDGVESESPNQGGSYYSSELFNYAKNVHEDDNINFVYIDIESTSDTKNSIESLKFFMDEVEGEYIGNVTSVSGVKGIKSLGAEVPEDTDETPLPDYFDLIPYSPDHFITKNVNLSAAIITGYNDVTPKAGAERLVTTSSGKPVLTTWRFGLGRVAAFTTDNGEGEGTRWASALYNGSNSRLISGTTNWAIGNPQAEEGAVVEAPDTWLGTPSDLTLIMYDEGVPQLKLDGASLDLALTGRNTYEASINPVNVGIHDISGYPLAVNYPREYLEVGLNKDIEPLILATGGKIYTEKEARALLLKDARQNSERESNDPVSLKVYVLLAALVLYLGEILVRRIREMRRLKQAQGETETGAEEAAA
ncbi:hypothetical protein [Methanosarcina sp. 1.H.A.2.2]|uniref:hypothetical protein n=1 Tax=Methanosarcina sp. 1.H.A.2.2 TaxID=1483601 RepID=UPI000622A7D3|nr:hypothetical protein [Methanosarcina sp. 1.H.A.2.2]KKH45884.1 von Willebrand factor A [Methanosarcina sp. 1.H.A.2.2]